MWRQTAVRRLTIGAVATVSALLMLSPPAGAAAKTEVQPPEEELEVFLDHPRPSPSGVNTLEGTHVLDLRIFPLRGVAVVSTETNDEEILNKESVNYVERIPKVPFDGHVDLDFEGLGSFVGDFTPAETNRQKRQKNCAGRPYEFVTGSFTGSIDFPGWDGYAGWGATSADAFLERSFELRCHPGAAERVRKPKTLTDYVAPGGGSPANWRYGLRATQRRSRRFTELNVFSYERPHVHGIDLDATTYERLADGIVAGRTIRRAVPLGHQLMVASGSRRPRRAVLRPPAPFSGVGFYSRGTHRLTGSLAVQFPGLRYRLAGSDTVANLVDEAGLPEKKPSENE